MILAIDIGNTNIVFSLYDGKWIEGLRIKTHSKDYIRQASKYIEEVCFDHCIISSVVPKITPQIEQLIKRKKKTNPVIISNRITTGLVNSSIPDECGNDLICNAVAGHSLFPDRYVVIADYGTAFTTITVSPKGEVLGVTIGPGLITSLKALFLNTAQIPRIMLDIPDTVLGRTTEEAVKAGVIFGFTGQLDAIVSKIEEETGHEVCVVVTGGFSKYVRPLLKKVDYTDINLTLDGARQILEKNI